MKSKASLDRKKAKEAIESFNALDSIDTLDSSIIVVKQEEGKYHTNQWGELDGNGTNPRTDDRSNRRTSGADQRELCNKQGEEYGTNIYPWVNE